MATNKPVILVVDDTPDNLALASVLLKDKYTVKVANSGARALSIIADSPPELILLDIMMPGMDGYEVCRRIKAQPERADIPLLFLTAKSEVDAEELGFSLGAVDYIIKPLNPSILLSRIHTHLTLKQARDYLKNQNYYLEEEVNRRVKEISLIQEVSISAMASLAETRDNETGSHIKRTAAYMKELALYLQGNPTFSEDLTAENIRLLIRSAPLHDIGKVGIPDNILLKADRLTDAEFEIMKTHTTLGRDAILKAEIDYGKKSETFLRIAKQIAYSHHEKWNGTGYPEGIAGEAIPVAARLMAIADVYDAIISNRVYKPGMPHEAAVAIIKADAGRHFDPDVVEAFLALAARFRAISEEIKDG